jgi:hypothetical protein
MNRINRMVNTVMALLLLVVFVSKELLKDFFELVRSISFIVNSLRLNGSDLILESVYSIVCPSGLDILIYVSCYQDHKNKCDLVFGNPFQKLFVEHVDIDCSP